MRPFDTRSSGDTKYAKGRTFVRTLDTQAILRAWRKEWMSSRVGFLEFNTGSWFGGARARLRTWRSASSLDSKVPGISGRNSVSSRMPSGSATSPVNEGLLVVVGTVVDGIPKGLEARGGGGNG